MYEKSAFVFWATLILYILTLSTISYVGVYLTYIAIPTIIISGLIMKLSTPKSQTQKILDDVSLFAKEANKVTNDFLGEINNSLSQFNEKSELIHNKTEGLRARKHSLTLQKIGPELELKREENLSRKNELSTTISNIDREIREIEKEIDQIKRECELQVSRKYTK